MVAALSVHPDLSTAAAELFVRWKEEAMKVADLLDPMKRPFVTLIPAFNDPPAPPGA
jgi:hypothetical protein